MEHLCGKQLCIKLPMPIEVIKRHFHHDYCYMFNLNPDPSKYTSERFSKFLLYLRKQNVNYWLVECLSPSGYRHYHGMIRLNYIKVDIVKTKLAIAKQINIYVGRSVPLERPDSIVAWYNYIHSDSNNIKYEILYICAPSEALRAGPSGQAQSENGSLFSKKMKKVPWDECYD